MSKNKLDAIRREYGIQQLDEQSLRADPIDQFQVWLNEAIASETIDPTAMVVSTVDDQDQPDARIILLKDILPQGFVFYTHACSAKGKQLATHPFCALTFYWPCVARQVRIRGQVGHVDTMRAQQYFESRPHLSQISSFISPQSHVIQDRQMLEKAFKMAQKQYPPGVKVPLPQDWQGYIVTPQVIEFWQGCQHRLHDRIVYSKINTGWKMQRLAP